MAVSNGVVVVGAYGWEGAGPNGNNQGSAYAFDAASGQQLRQLVASDGSGSDQFGIAVAIEGNQALVGAQQFDRATGGPRGCAYLFDLTSGSQTHQVLPLNAGTGDRFGSAVALDVGRALVGTKLDAYAYLFDSSSGEQLAAIRRWGGSSGTALGAVAIDGTNALVGAPGSGGPGSSSRLFTTVSTEDAFEDNDACAAAVPLAAGDYLSLTITPPSVPDGSDADLDFYAGTLHPGFELQLAIDFDPQVQDLDLYLHDASQGCTGTPLQVSQSSDFNTGLESITWLNGASQALDYVVEVRFPNNSTGSQTCNPYGLTLAHVGIPQSFCTSTVNGSGSAATLDWSGSTSVAANDLVLMASGCPANQFGIYIYADAEQQLPLGDGFLCIGGGNALVRLNTALQIDTSGQANLSADLTSFPFNAGPGEIQAGSTWSFQFWFRDPGGVSGFNLSDGLRVPFGI